MIISYVFAKAMGDSKQVTPRPLFSISIYHNKCPPISQKFPQPFEK